LPDARKSAPQRFRTIETNCATVRFFAIPFIVPGVSKNLSNRLFVRMMGLLSGETNMSER
jgi:hypothetical protein